MKEGTTYRVLKPVVLSTDCQIYMPGDIVDLSHLTSDGRRYFVDRGYYETADGEPKNLSAQASGDEDMARASPCRGCK